MCVRSCVRVCVCVCVCVCVYSSRLLTYSAEKYPATLNIVVRLDFQESPYMRVSQGGVLVPFQNFPMIPCSRTFSVFVLLVMNLLTMFSSSNL